MPLSALFAVGEWPNWLTGLLGGGGGAGLAAGVYKLAKWWERYKVTSSKARVASEDAISRRLRDARDAEERRDRVALDEWKEVVAHLHQTVEKLEKAEAEARRRELACQQQNNRHERVIVYLHGVVCHQNALLRDRGVPVEDIRPLSDFLPDGQDEGVDRKIEQDRRTVAQAAVLVKAEAEKMVPGVSKNTDGGGSGGTDAG